MELRIVLQICFVNEFASDEEASEGREEAAVLTREEIARSNISKRVSQIIVPLAAVSHQVKLATKHNRQRNFLKARREEERLIRIL